MNRLLVIIILLSISTVTFSQNEDATASKWDFSVSSDLVSRYVWRGNDFGNSPAFQPDLEFSYKNLTAGAWGSASLTSFNLQETDLFLSFDVWKLKFTCWDYFYMNTDSMRNSYFEYSDGSTGHDFSFDAEFLWSENIPLKILASYNFYGADTLHSSYFELSYTCNKKLPVELFAGFTPNEGWYGNGPGFVNVGLGLTKECYVSEKYSIPVYGKLIFNPQKENIHIVAGITF